MTFKKFLSVAIRSLILTLVLFGCASNPAPLITNHCEIPENLDYVAEGPTLLPEVPTSPQQHDKDEATERAAHKQLSNDFNALHDHVRDHCK